MIRRPPRSTRTGPLVPYPTLCRSYPERFFEGHLGRRRTIMGRSEFDYLPPRPAWNAGRKVGAKRPLKPRQIWAIRFHLDREHRLRDRALFDLAIDSKLRGCDLEIGRAACRERGCQYV